MKNMKIIVCFLVVALAAPALVQPASAGTIEGLNSALLDHPRFGNIDAVDRAAYVTIAGSSYLCLEARANSHVAGRQENPALAVDSEGNLTLVWQSRRQDGPGYDVFGQCFDALGRRLGAETRLNELIRPVQKSPSVSVDVDGRPFICWESLGRDGSLGGVVARSFDQGLRGRAPELVVNELTTGEQGEAVTLATGDGRVLVAWAGPEKSGGLPRVWARWFTLEAEPLGESFRLTRGEAGGERLPSLALLPDGGIAAVYAALDDEGRPAGIFCRVFDRQAHAGEAHRVDDGTGLTAIEPSVTAGPAGRLLVTWLEYGGEQADYDVHARLLDSKGRAGGNAFRVHGNTPGTQNGVAAAFSDAGDFMIAWNHRELGSGDTDIMGRLFDGSGSPVTDSVRLTLSADGEQRLAEATGRVRLACGRDGEWALAWSGEGAGLDDDHGVYLTLLTPVPDRCVAGDLDGDGIITRKDSELFNEVLSGRDLSPARFALSDLNRDGRADMVDMAIYPLNSDLEGEREVRQAELLTQTVRSAVEQRRQREAARMASGRQVADVVVITDAAVPHEPPVRIKDFQAALDPFGGDPAPYPLADSGFLGITSTGWDPPDPHLAVGPNQVVGMTNGAIAFFDKDGTKTFQDEIEDSYGFWGSVGATGFVFDPEVLYDPHSSRFMAMACERGTSSDSYFLLAVSDDSNPNGTWYKYRINATPQCGSSIDSPNIAVDGQAVYLTADCWTGINYVIYILNKTPLLSGGSATITNTLTITGPQSHGIPVTYGTAPAMYMIEHFESGTNTSVRLHAITDPLGSASRVSTLLTVPSYSPPEDPPQLGTSTRPETFDNRFWSCVWRNGSLWAAHHQGSSRVLARWYEIDTGNWPVSGSPTLVQSGDLDLGSGVRTFFNSISADDAGNAVMCYARSSSTERISMGRAARCADDPLGTLPDVVTQKASTGYSSSRWGDYSAVAVDPSDGVTFWMHHEYAPSNSSWNTWIGALDPECGVVPEDTLSVSLGCSPSSGTVPFSSQFWVQMTNLVNENRRAAARIDAQIASGVSYSNWKSGWTNLDPYEVYAANWSQSIPALASVIGDNVFTLSGEDVTPAPFNQPPYQPAGDTDVSACTVTGIAP